MKELLDMVRCSVTFNTITHLVAGYKGFLRAIESGQASMELARIKNGFLDDEESGYRDLKINVIFSSKRYPETKMICEVQFILNQYLYEKKKMHKLYSIIRDEIYYEMVLRQETAKQKAIQNELKEDDQWAKALDFEPVLNVQKEVNVMNSNSWYYKCGMMFCRCFLFAPKCGVLLFYGKCHISLMSAVQPQHELLSMNIDGEQCVCVDMKSNSVVFEAMASRYHTNHWIQLDDKPYLSLLTAKNIIKFYGVDVGSNTFEEDESLRITLSENDEVCKWA